MSATGREFEELNEEIRALWRFVKAYDELEKLECNWKKVTKEEYNNLVYELRKSRIALYKF